MKRSVAIFMLVSTALGSSVLAGGCGPKAEITPEKKAQFGTANQAMPPGVAEKVRAATAKAQSSGKAGVK